MLGFEAFRVGRRDQVGASSGDRVGRRVGRRWPHVLLACSLFAAATGAGVIATEPASAAGPPVPFVDCVVHEGGTIWSVYFGYSNSGPMSVDIPVGPNNIV